MLCARAMHLGEFAIRAQDLLYLIQLPGLIISGLAFFVAALRGRREGAWDVTVMLAMVCSTIGIALTIFLVALQNYPSPFHRLTPKEAWFLCGSGKKASPTFFGYIDASATFALVVLDGWFCMAWVAVLDWSRRTGRSTAA
jgi:hypothetical protein